MLNALRPALTRLLTPVADALARTPVTPNALTITGTAGMTAGALWLFPTGHLFAGTMVCTGFVLADMLDGLLACSAALRPAFTPWLPHHKPPARIARWRGATVGCVRWTRSRLEIHWMCPSIGRPC